MKRYFIAIFLALAVVTPRASFAATGVAMAVTGPMSVSVGQEFNVTVQISGAVDIDTVRAVGTYPSNLLELRGIRSVGAFTNVSPGNSIDANAGTFSYGTFALEKYANGTAKFAVMTFKARTEGIATIRLLPESVAYSAGEGTVSSVGSLKVIIAAIAPAIPLPIKKLGITTPAATGAITLTSSSHPDPNAWVANNVVQVSWKTTKPIETVFGAFDQSPESNAYHPIIGTSATFTATQDGVWYVHLAIVFQDKTYARVDFPVRIDRTPPRPIASVVDQTIATPADVNSVRFATVDDTSGISAYDLFIDGRFVTSTLLNAFSLTGLPVGEHEILVKAFDRAGNFVTGTTHFLILGAKTLFLTGALAIGCVILALVGIAITFVLFLRKKKRHES